MSHPARSQHRGDNHVQPARSRADISALETASAEPGDELVHRVIPGFQIESLCVTVHTSCWRYVGRRMAMLYEHAMCSRSRATSLTVRLILTATTRRGGMDEGS